MKKNAKRGHGPELSNSDPEARRRAAAVLEVLGGLLTPTAAAESVGLSLPRHYALEKKALEALAAACMARGRKGRRPSPEREADRLRERVKRLERESSRNLALLRAAQRALGWSAPPAKAEKPGKGGGKGGGRKRRRPVARALAVAESLRKEPPIPAAAS
jgi:hypothetical protein